MLCKVEQSSIYENTGKSEQRMPQMCDVWLNTIQRMSEFATDY